MEFVTIAGSKFVLGGNEVKFKGVNYSDPNSPWVWSRNWDPEAVKTGLAAARELGMNCIRLWTPSSPHEISAGAPHPCEMISQILDVAEQNGIRVYLGFRWQHKWTEPGTLEDKANLEYLGQLLDLCKDDPRIIAYDLMNEADHMSGQYWQWNMNPAGAVTRLRWLRRMCEAIKETDTVHPVTMGAVFSYSFWTPMEPFALESFVDFIDFHYYRRNYREATLADSIRSVRERTDKPILLGEFGFSSDPEFSTLGEEVHSEQLQAERFEEYLSDCETEDISGAIAWALTDYNGTFELGEGYYGILSADYSHKPVSAVFKQRFPVTEFK